MLVYLHRFLASLVNFTSDIDSLFSITRLGKLLHIFATCFALSVVKLC